MNSGVPHETQFAREFGRSPGNGVTSMPLSMDPLATEGEATPGPDDVNPYEEREHEDAKGWMDASRNDGPAPQLPEHKHSGVELSDLDAPGIEAPSLSLEDLFGGGDDVF